MRPKNFIIFFKLFENSQLKFLWNEYRMKAATPLDRDQPTISI